MIQWLPDYAVGVPLIDREHQHLFVLAERMHQALLTGQGKAALDSLLSELIAYTSNHFAHEERLMERVGYPDLGDHRSQHVDLQTKVRAMQKRAAAGEGTMTIEVMQFLIEWLKRHTTTSDRRIGSFIVARGLPLAD